jgi:5-methylcytosine-specific restriction endonuclease McrA
MAKRPLLSWFASSRRTCSGLNGRANQLHIDDLLRAISSLFVPGERSRDSQNLSSRGAIRQHQFKRALVRLDESAYKELRLRVLRRDGWRCQFCGSMTNLEVHHQQLRRHSGSGHQGNLITLSQPMSHPAMTPAGPDRSFESCSVHRALQPLSVRQPCYLRVGVNAMRISVLRIPDVNRA